MANRRVFGGRADHGAQYFTCRTGIFQSYVDRWIRQGIIREWFRHMPDDRSPDGYPRYRGAEGMTSVPKALAQELKVICGQEVYKVVRTDGEWLVETAQGNTYRAPELVLTAPLPQSVAILNGNGIRLHRELSEVRYEKGIAALVHLDGPSGLTGSGGIKIDSDVLSWVADNQLKGISGSAAVLTLHSTVKFAEQYWNAPDDLCGRLMIDEISGGLEAGPLDHVCHRWRFTTPVNPLEQKYLRDESLQLTLAGDAFGGPRVEGAALSGLAAADGLESARAL
jgi:predicted NAD/FAD-dependent oxidoreductase